MRAHILKSNYNHDENKDWIMDIPSQSYTTLPYLNIST